MTQPDVRISEIPEGMRMMVLSTIMTGWVAESGKTEWQPFGDFKKSNGRKYKIKITSAKMTPAEIRACRSKDKQEAPPDA